MSAEEHALHTHITAGVGALDHGLRFVFKRKSTRATHLVPYNYVLYEKQHKLLTVSASRNDRTMDGQYVYIQGGRPKGLELWDRFVERFESEIMDLICATDTAAVRVYEEPNHEHYHVPSL